MSLLRKNGVASAHSHQESTWRTENKEVKYYRLTITAGPFNRIGVELRQAQQRERTSRLQQYYFECPRMTC